MGANLHWQRDHPIGIIKQAIYDYFEGEASVGVWVGVCVCCCLFVWLFVCWGFRVCVCLCVLVGARGFGRCGVYR
jgi:hypothetical protein